MKTLKKLLLIMFHIVLTIALYSENDVPEWFLNKPMDESNYFFVGMASHTDKSIAYKYAKRDVYGSVVSMINVSITQETEFESVYTRNENNNSHNTTFHKRIKTISHANVSGIEHLKNHFVFKNEKYTVYILSKISKSDLKKAKIKIVEEKVRIKQLKVMCIVLDKYYDGRVQNNQDYENFIKSFYSKEIGYNIEYVEIPIWKLRSLNYAELIMFFKRFLINYDRLIIGINFIDQPSTKSISFLGNNIKTIAFKGKFLLATVDLKSINLDDQSFDPRNVTYNERNEFFEYGFSLKTFEDAVENYHKALFSFLTNSDDTILPSLYSNLRQKVIKLFLNN